jgi:hypothetical protein
MSPETKSKAQRRAEAQRRAAEQRAAEKRKKRTRLGVRVGGAVVVLALVIVLIVVVSGGSSGTPQVFKNPHVALEPIPASMKASWVQPPAGKPGPEVIPLTTGPKLATLVNAATGQNVDGVQCNAGEKTVSHVHTHLTIFVNGQSRVIPYGVGIPGFQAEEINPPAPAGPGPFVVTGTCYYWLHRRHHPHRVTEHDPGLHPGTVLRRVGYPPEFDPGGLGDGQRHRLLHLARQGPDALHGRPAQLAAG